MKELEVYRMRAAAELDKDMAQAVNSAPRRGFILREGERIDVQIFDCWKETDGQIVTHRLDSQGNLISRDVFESFEEISKSYGRIHPLTPPLSSL